MGFSEFESRVTQRSQVILWRSDV